MVLAQTGGGGEVIVIIDAAVDPETGEPIEASPGPDPLKEPTGGISQAVWDKLRELYGENGLVKAKRILEEWNVKVYNGKQRHSLDHGGKHITVVGKTPVERARALHSALSNLSSIEKFVVVDPSQITAEQAIELIHASGYHDGENIVVTLDDGTRVVLEPVMVRKRPRTPKAHSHYAIAWFGAQPLANDMRRELVFQFRSPAASHVHEELRPGSDPGSLHDLPCLRPRIATRKPVPEKCCPSNGESAAMETRTDSIRSSSSTVEVWASTGDKTAWSAAGGLPCRRIKKRRRGYRLRFFVSGDDSQGTSLCDQSDRWFPAGFVFALPEGHGFVVTHDVAVFAAAIQGTAGAVGDVAQVAEQRALVAGFDFLVQLHRRVVTDAGYEIVDVFDVALVAFDLVNELVDVVVDRHVPAAFDDHRAGLAVKRDESVAMAVAAHAIPRDRLLAFKLVRDVVRVGSLLIVVKSVATAS